MGRLLLLCLVVALPAGAGARQEANQELIYLRNSAWLVRLADYNLLFDYVPPFDGSIETNDDLLAALSGTKPLYVFVSHEHSDHYSQAIFDWENRSAGMEVVFGSQSRDVARPVRRIGARESLSLGDMTIWAFRSTDAGVGFLVRTPDVVVLHAGDHARWSPADDVPFRTEIDWVADLTPAIDLALLPIATGVACDPRPSIWEGVGYAAVTLKPRFLVPMHVRCNDRLRIYTDFGEWMAGWFGDDDTTILVAEVEGQRFSLAASGQ